MHVFEQRANMTNAIKPRMLIELTEFISYYEVIVDQIQESHGITQVLQFPSFHLQGGW